MGETKQTNRRDRGSLSNSKPGALGILLRLLAAGLTGLLLGAAVYLSLSGWIPMLKDDLLQPVHQNTSRLQTLEAQHSTLQALSRTPSSLITEISALETAQFDFQETIQSLESAQSELISTLTVVERTLDPQAGQLAALSTQAAALQESQDRNQAVIGYLATRQAASASLPFDIHLTQLLLWINRAHQDILHNDYGQAEEEIKQAELRLAQLADQSPGAQQDSLNEALTLLSKASENLPGNPDLAKEQLDLAWALLLETVNQTSQPGVSQTPTPTEIRSLPSTPTPSLPTTPSS